MPDQNASLGGRVPLFDPHALTTAQKPVYDSMVEEMVPWAKAVGLTAMLDDGRLVGPFNTILESPGIAAAFLALQAAEQKHTTLSKRVRQVVILTLGAVWKCDYASKTNYLYYTATAKKLFMRVKVDGETFEPAGEPELVVSGRMGDDFCLDEEAEVIYLATHRQNTIDVVFHGPRLEERLHAKRCRGSFHRAADRAVERRLAKRLGRLRSGRLLHHGWRHGVAATLRTQAGAASQSGVPASAQNLPGNKCMMDPRRTGTVVKGKDVAIETYIDGQGPCLVILPSYGRDGGKDLDNRGQTQHS